jgi:SAM-dependent methyltransferase
VKTIESRSMVDISDEARERTLARFAEHRRAWDQNPALRELYGHWYGRVRGCLPPIAVGPWIELGSGPGFGRSFIPAMELSDLVMAPWHDRQMAAETLSLADESVGALVLFDVLHHLSAPAKFFSEASRVLRRGGRIVLCEPHISALSWPVYHFLHEEPVILGVDPLAEQGGPGKDPFDSNQAIPTILFGKRRAEFASRFPSLRIHSVEHLAGLAYPSSGGFSRAPLLPLPVWKALHRFESLIPPAAFRWIGFRLLAVIEKI